MEKKYVDYSSCKAGVPGAKQDISGCNFMLAPMADNYEEIILGAIQKLDTSRVWSSTTKMGTVYRGRRDDVLDAVKACFAYAWRKDVHMTLEMTLTKGCPGDGDEDYVLSDLPGLANEEGIKDISFPVDCKYALYPLGSDSYMQAIEDVVNEAVDRGLYTGTVHYASILKGDVHELFDYFGWLFRYCEENMSHFVIEVTLSVNSPTPDA